MKILFYFVLCFSFLSNTLYAVEKETLPAIENPFSAPNFNLIGEDGKRYRLSDYRGKVVVINFWATWCPPCREEMPSMERLWQKVKNKNIVILAINVGEDADTIFEFTGQYPVTFALPMDTDGEVLNNYPARALPTTYIINPKGIATHRAIGSREWDSEQMIHKLTSLLKK